MNIKTQKKFPIAAIFFLIITLYKMLTAFSYIPYLDFESPSPIYMGIYLSTMLIFLAYTALTTLLFLKHHGFYLYVAISAIIIFQCCNSLINIVSIYFQSDISYLIPFLIFFLLETLVWIILLIGVMSSKFRILSKHSNKIWFIPGAVYAAFYAIPYCFNLFQLISSNLSFYFSIGFSSTTILKVIFSRIFDILHVLILIPAFLFLVKWSSDPYKKIPVPQEAIPTYDFPQPVGVPQQNTYPPVQSTYAPPQAPTWQPPLYPPIMPLQNDPIHKTDLEKIELLKKYKELLDAGIITQEEFEKKKKELL